VVMSVNELVPVIGFIKLKQLQVKAQKLTKNNELLQVYIREVKKAALYLVAGEHTYLKRYKSRMTFGKQICDFYQNLKKEDLDNSLIIGAFYLAVWAVVNSIKRNRLTVALTRYFYKLNNAHVFFWYIEHVKQICEQISCNIAYLDIIKTSVDDNVAQMYIEYVSHVYSKQFKQISVFSMEEVNGELITAALGTIWQ